MILLVDNFDSFSYNLVDYLSQLGKDVEVIRNDRPADGIDLSSYSAIVFSPGPETPERSGFLMDMVKCSHGKLPLLGICLGHQAIGEYFGARLVKAVRPMHGKPSRISFSQDPVFADIEQGFEAIRYNSLVLQDIVGPLKVIAWSEENEAMAIRHNELPIWGFQFHPEAARTKFGLKMLSNWIEYNNIV